MKIADVANPELIGIVYVAMPNADYLLQREVSNPDEANARIHEEVLDYLAERVSCAIGPANWQLDKLRATFCEQFGPHYRIPLRAEDRISDIQDALGSDWSVEWVEGYDVALVPRRRVISVPDV